MGSKVGHVAPGAGFLLIGLWHLFNHIKLQSQHPSTYTSKPWFPSPHLRYLESILIMAGSCLSIAMDLFIGLSAHQPLDVDGTIPSNHLHNFEHASISLALFLYAVFTVYLDRSQVRGGDALIYFLCAVVFSQELLMFHLHSTDHVGVEGQYHWLLQLVIAVSLVTTLMSIGYRKSFMVSFVKSASIAFQGVWFIVMGFALWTPELIPKGCFMNDEDGRMVVSCHGQAALDRATSLVNLQFSWFLSGFAVLVVIAYVMLTEWFPESPEYMALEKAAAAEECW